MLQPGVQVLYEFKAGRCNRDGKKVVPEDRKGLIQIFQTLLDGLTHFAWFDRSTNVRQDDLVIFPDDAKWRRLPQNRMFLLEFASAPDRKFFYWSQEDASKDAEIEDTVQQIIAAPPLVADGSAPVSPAGAGVAPPAPGGAKPAAADVSSALNSILSGLIASQGQSATAASAGTRAPSITLTNILHPDEISKFLRANPDVQERLLPHMPAGLQSAAELFDFIHSAQYRQAVDVLHYALASGQLQYTVFRDIGLSNTQNIRSMAILPPTLPSPLPPSVSLPALLAFSLLSSVVRPTHTLPDAEAFLRALAATPHAPPAAPGAAASTAPSASGDKSDAMDTK